MVLMRDLVDGKGFHHVKPYCLCGSEDDARERAQKNNTRNLTVKERV
jgi:hypothetical protein